MSSSASIVPFKTPASVTSGIAFEQYLRNWFEHIRREGEKTRKLGEMALTMHRRDRGLTLSDMCGRFGIRRETDGRWLDYDQDLDGEIHPINIVGPTLATNKNACLQSNSETEVTSANASAKNKLIAMRWQKCADYWERTSWDEAKRGFIFDATQKAGTTIIETLAKECDRTSVQNVAENATGVAVFHCENCKQNGIAQVPMPDNDGDEQGPDTDNDGDGMTEIPCPQCGMPAPAMVKSLSSFDLTDEDVPVYDIVDETHSFFNFFIDSYNARVKGIHGAKWIDIHRLYDRMELETDYPHFQFSSPLMWTFPVRCDYALANADWSYLLGSYRNSVDQLFELFEGHRIFLHEEAYQNYRAPADYEFVDGKGQVAFTIKAGQTIMEAQKAKFGDDYTGGFAFLWCDDRLVSIFSPKTEELNLRKRFKDIHWSRDSGSYYSAPFYSIVYLQDDVTLLNTLNHNIVARNAVQQVYYNSEVFDKADFSQEYIGTKNAHLLPDGDMSKAAFSLPIPTPSPYLSQQLEFLWSIKDNVSQVTPAMRGESQKGTPYAAQRQQLEQSMGNLTSVLKSFAQCKTGVFLDKANLAKRFWTLEQFQRVGSMFGELWTEDDVTEMCEIDLEKDLIVSYVNGTEMPSTSLSREMKFYGALQQLLPFMQAGVPLPPEAMQQILQKIDEFGEFDFDLTGLEVNELISQKRIIELSELCADYGDATFDQVEAMKQNVVAIQPPTAEVTQQSIQLAQSAPDDPQVIAQAQQMVQPTPITEMDILTEHIFTKLQVAFSKYEDLDQQHAAFVEYLRGEIGKTKPNYVLIEMLTVLLAMLEQAIEGVKQEAMAKDPSVQAAQAAEEKQKEDVQRQQALEEEKLQSDNANKAADRELKAKEIELKAQLESQGHALDAAKHVASLENEGEESGETEEMPAPIDKVAESISYKDLPDAGKIQLADHAGIDISKSDLKSQKADELKTAKASKPAATAKPAPKK